MATSALPVSGRPTPALNGFGVSLALTTMATLILELSLTRIFSVVLYYHFAFLAISIAMFGLGAGGVFSYVVARWRAPLLVRLGRLSMVNSLLVILALATVLAQTSAPSYAGLAVIYFATALPFFVSGAIVSLAISETISHVNRVYFFDLAGAAAGCLLLIPLLNLAGGPGAVVASATLFAAAAALWYALERPWSGRTRLRVFSALLLTAGFVALLVYNHRHHLFEPGYAKGRPLKHEVFVQWNSFSRIAVVQPPATGEASIFIDADASTVIANSENFDFDRLTEAERRAIFARASALPYLLHPGGKTLIIGPGGGIDVVCALAAGSRDVTGVEINPIIARTVMQERYAAHSHGLYHRPDVRIHVEDGRTFVRRSTERYDVLQATFVDTWAATAAGAFALSENNLYTTDAFREYLQHLTDGGIFAMTRWGHEPPRESLRLVSLAMEALAQLGETEPWRHVIVGREGDRGRGRRRFHPRDTVVVSRKPLSETLVNRAVAEFTAGTIEPLYYPGGGIENEFSQLLQSPDPTAYQRRYPFDISPVSDNRPFFFYTVQPRDLWATISGKGADVENRAAPLLMGLLAISVVATVVILALPPLLLGTRLPRQRGVYGFLVYFLLIGAGYILIEIALIQKFVLFLGQPALSLGLVIFAMLLSSGIGSACSGWILGGRDIRLVRALGGVAVLTAALGLALAPLLTALVGLPLPWKCVVAVLLIGPAGFVMGMPFPTALRRLEGRHPPAVRWAWSLNSAASVLGSVGALLFGIHVGLAQTLLLGSFLYLGAATLVAFSWKD
jgi:hypothetical protein